MRLAALAALSVLLVGLARGASLSSLITTTKLNVSTSVSTSDYEWGPYIRQVPNGNIKVAWIDFKRSNITVHHLTAQLTTQRAPTIITGYGKLSGFEVHSDGRVALLAVDINGCDGPCVASSSCSACLKLYLIVINALGVVTSTTLVEDRYFKQDGKFASAGIAIGNWKGQGETYGIMRSVRGTGSSAFCNSSASNSGHQWSETWIYDATTLEVKLRGCNSFPCGHSIGLKQIAFHPVAKTFGTTCTGDYKGGPNDLGFRFARDADNWDAKTIHNVWKNWPDFANPGNPGEIVPIGTDQFLISCQAPKTIQEDLQDLLVARVSSNGTLLGGPWWYTALAGVINPHLAKYGDNFVIGWQTTDGNFIAVIDENGNILTGPQNISSVTKFGMAARWITLQDGSVMWVRNQATTVLEIVKLALSAVTTPVPTESGATQAPTPQGSPPTSGICGDGFVDAGEECDEGILGGECTPEPGEVFCQTCGRGCKFVEDLVVSEGIDLAFGMDAAAINSVLGLSAPLVVSGCAKLAGDLVLRSTAPLQSGKYSIIQSNSGCIGGQFDEVHFENTDPLAACYQIDYTWMAIADPDWTIGELQLVLDVTADQQCIDQLHSAPVASSDQSQQSENSKMKLSVGAMAGIAVGAAVVAAAVIVTIVLVIRRKQGASVPTSAASSSEMTPNDVSVTQV